MFRRLVSYAFGGGCLMRREIQYFVLPIVKAMPYFQFYSNDLTLRQLMSYIYGAPILDVSRSHTTTQHSR